VTLSVSGSASPQPKAKDEKMAEIKISFFMGTLRFVSRCRERYPLDLPRTIPAWEVSVGFRSSGKNAFGCISETF
jgi:hypothetical protein